MDPQITSSLNFTKIMGSAILLCLAIFGGFAPFICKSFAKPETSKRILAIANAFGGGVILTVPILHVLPEAFKAFSQIKTEAYPLPGLCCVAIFMFLFSIDKFIDTHQHQPLSASNGTPNKNNELQMEIVNQISKNDQNLTNIPDKGAIPQIVLLFALSIHAMFEGLAIGVAETVSSCWQLILAVSCHKWAEALAMGVSSVTIVESQRKLSIIITLVLCLMSPIGILIGKMICSIDQANMIWLMYGLASGSFIYIATIEILAKLFKKKDQTDKFLKLIGIVCGAGVICLAQLLD